MRKLILVIFVVLCAGIAKAENPHSLFDFRSFDYPANDLRLSPADQSVVNDGIKQIDVTGVNLPSCKAEQKISGSFTEANQVADAYFISCTPEVGRHQINFILVTDRHNSQRPQKIEGSLSLKVIDLNGDGIDEVFIYGGGTGAGGEYGSMVYLVSLRGGVKKLAEFESEDTICHSTTKPETHSDSASEVFLIKKNNAEWPVLSVQFYRRACLENAKWQKSEKQDVEIK